LREFAEEGRILPKFRQSLYESSKTYAKYFERWLAQDFQAYLKSVYGMTDLELMKVEDSLRLTFWNPTPSMIRYPNGLPFMVNSVRLAYRINQEQYSRPDLVVEVSQARRGYIDPETQAKVDLGKIPPPPAEFLFLGGATFLISLESGRVRYVIGKSVTSERRLDALRRFLLEGIAETSLQATYFGDPLRNALQENAKPFELFALLHQDHGEGESQA
jgi:hypothetical protein